MVIYLDYASSAPVRPECVEVMTVAMREFFYNPSQKYSGARRAKQLLEEAREDVASRLGVMSDEVIWTSGGTESCNLAIFGSVKATDKKKVVTTQIEHSAVLKSCEYLESKGYEVCYLSVDANGLIDLEELRREVDEETALVAIICVNNEIGVVQEYEKIGEICKEKGAKLFFDACQAVLGLEVEKLGEHCDMYALNSRKIGGPLGVGALICKAEHFLEPMIYGGEQELSKRAGTENLPAILGFAKALELSLEEREVETLRIKEMRDWLWEELSKIEGVRLNGGIERRAVNNLNILVEGVEAESAIIRLDQKGVLMAAGSACNALSNEPSQVLLAIGLSRTEAFSSLRLSFGYNNRLEEMPIVLEALKEVIAGVRGV